MINHKKSIAFHCRGFFIDLKRWKSIELVDKSHFSDKLIQNPCMKVVFLLHTKSRDHNLRYAISIYKVVIAVCLFVCSFDHNSGTLKPICLKIILRNSGCPRECP